jgi:hypothetical protein
MFKCCSPLRRVAPIPGYFQTTNEGATGPSHSGTGDATDLNPESVRDAPSQSPEVALRDLCLGKAFLK